MGPDPSPTTSSGVWYSVGSSSLFIVFFRMRSVYSGHQKFDLKAYVMSAWELRSVHLGRHWVNFGLIGLVWNWVLCIYCFLRDWKNLWSRVKSGAVTRSSKLQVIEYVQNTTLFIANWWLIRFTIWSCKRIAFKLICLLSTISLFDIFQGYFQAFS